MPSQINTKSCPERISFAPPRHGRYFNRDTFVPRCTRKNWISKREKGSGSLFSAYPKICCALFAARVKNVFDVDIVRVHHLLQTVIVLFVCKSRMFHYLFYNYNTRVHIVVKRYMRECMMKEIYQPYIVIGYIYIFYSTPKEHYFL